MALIPSQVLRVAILLSYFSILCHYKALDMPAHQTYGGSWKFLTFIDLVGFHILSAFTPKPPLSSLNGLLGRCFVLWSDRNDYSAFPPPCLCSSGVWFIVNIRGGGTDAVIYASLCLQLYLKPRTWVTCAHAVLTAEPEQVLRCRRLPVINGPPQRERAARPLLIPTALLTPKNCVAPWNELIVSLIQQNTRVLRSLRCNM